MLLPYRDINPSRLRPYVTWMLISVNILFFLTYGLPSFDDHQPVLSDLENAWENWSLFPGPYISLSGLFTHMFLHGGWLHLLGNMLMLYIFGNNLEDVLGHVRFLLFYLACGLAAGLFFAVTESDPMTRAGGASGAIAGVMGGYLLLFPRAKIMSLLLLPNIIWPFSIIIRLFWKARIWGYWPILFLTFGVPAWVYLGVWAGLNILGAYSGLTASGIAYSIHLAGFVTGMALIMITRSSRRRPQIQETVSEAGRGRAGTESAAESKKPVPGPWDKPAPAGNPVPAAMESTIFLEGRPASGPIRASAAEAAASAKRTDRQAKRRPGGKEADPRKFRNATPIEWRR